LTVYAFEPVPVIRKKNQALQQANGLKDENVLGLALSDQEGPQKIFIPVFSQGVEEEQTATLNANSWQAHHKQVETVEIQCTTLDTFAAGRVLPPGRCCLKIDVENVEAAVLRGGKKFITERRPWIVCEILPCEDYDPATQTLRNDNRATLAVATELGYIQFAITADGYFRMNPADFSRPRRLKYFLLAPREKISGDTLYLTRENVGEIFTA